MARRILMAALVAACVSGSAPALALGILCGTVRDAQTQQPAAAAGVFLYQADAYTGLHGATDVDGKYCIEDIPAGTYDIQVRIDDYETAWVAGVEVEDVATSVDISSGLPLRLDAPWPNPSGSLVNFGFAVGVETDVELSVYDARGRRVHTWSGHRDPGHLALPWNFIDESGRSVPSGVYFVRLRAGDRMLSRSFVRIR